MLRPAFATDIVMRPLLDPAQGQTSDYPGAVIDEALKRTQKQYGDFSYVKSAPTFPRERLLEELVLGTEVNITSIATQPLWEEKLLTIRIPIDMGLQNFRVSLIHRDTQKKLSTVRTLEDLQKLSMGAGAGWASRKIYVANGFEVVPGANYESLLKMLLAGRFDHYPRGLDEVFPEYDLHKSDNPDLAVETDLLIAMPLPTYIFVSPKAPQLAKRIEEGMESMVRDGTLRRLMLKFNFELLERANLCSRRVFHISNPLLTDLTPLKRKELWFDPFDKKTGICNRSLKTSEK